MLYNSRRRMKFPIKPKKVKGAHLSPVDALVYPRFSGVPTFMRLPHVPRADELDIALIGVPFDGGTTYRPGPRFGPRNIRVQSAMIRPWNPVLKTDPFSRWRIADYGDLSVNPLSMEETYTRITKQLQDVLKAKCRTVCVGGDHSILLPILRAVHSGSGPVALSANFIQNVAQLVEVYRFDQMKIESRFLAAPNIFVRAKASDRDAFNWSLSFCLGNHIVSTAIRKTDVAQHDIEFL
jgi:Arginase family